MKKTTDKQVNTETKQQNQEQEWPREGRVQMGKQPPNPRLMNVRVGEEILTVQVRDNRFYRANEKLTVVKVSDGVYVDARPKTNALLRGGQE